MNNILHMVEVKIYWKYETNKDKVIAEIELNHSIYVN